METSRKRQHLLMVVAACTLAGCVPSFLINPPDFSEQSAQSVPPPPRKVKVEAPKVTPVPAEPPAEVKKSIPDVIPLGEYVSGFDGWRGGAIVSREFTNEMGTPQAIVRVWTPELESFRECRLSPWLSGEEPTNDDAYNVPHDYRYLDVSATTADVPVVAVAYDVRVKGTGLVGDKANTYLQTLNPKDCTLGPRLDLGVSYEAAKAEIPVGFISYSEETLVLRVGSEAIGVNPQRREIVWRESFEWDTYSFPPHHPLGENTFLIDPYKEGFPTTVNNADTGQPIFSAPSEVEPAYTSCQHPHVHGRIGKDSYVICSVYLQHPYLVSGGNVQPLFNEVVEPKLTHLSRIDKDHWATFGFQQPFGDYLSSDQSLIRLTDTGEIVELLSAERVEALNLSIFGASGGKLYVKTTSELVELDTDGKETGRKWPLSRANDFSVPVEDRFIGGEVWTLWGLNAYGHSLYVTRAAKVPWDATY